MDSNFIKKIIIIVIASIIVIGILLILVLQIGFKDDRDNIQNVFRQGDVGEEVNYERYAVTDKTEYYTVRDCINTYLQACNKENDLFENETGRKEFLFSLLDKNYINDQAITDYNVFEKLDTYTTTYTFTPIEMDVIERDNTSKYITYGVVNDINSKYVEDLYIIVNLDYTNKTFSIEPTNNNYGSIKDIQVSNNDILIESTENNTYTMVTVDERYVANEHINFYKSVAVAKPELIYEMLDSEYRTKRFDGIEDFKNYIEDNKDYIPLTLNRQYMVNYYDECTDYIVLDQYGHLLTFRENKDYTLTMFLDDYTSETELYKTNYKKAKDLDKAVSSLSRFFEMLNGQDYKSAYGVLDDSFKQTYFKTQADFESYIKSKVFKYNTVNYGQYNNDVSNLHVFTVTVTDATAKNTNQVKFNVVLKLLEDTDFVMSFTEIA